jgi:hypothetical protein
LPISSDSQECNCTGTILWHKALVLELNGEPKRTYTGISCIKKFSGGYTPDPHIKGIKVRRGFKRNSKRGTKRK